MVTLIVIGVIAVIAIITFLSSLTTVGQGKVAVITRFGKFKEVFRPGLHFKAPLFDSVSSTISTQNQSMDVAFQAITTDQANVYFKAMILYGVPDGFTDDVIQNVAFKFKSAQDFTTALTRTIEGTIRGFVGGKQQKELLGLRSEITLHVKETLVDTLSSWGYKLLDLQVTDISFDKEIMESMSKVVASQNLKAAATNEGDALLIQRTKAAEAEGQFIKISADAEKTAAESRGQGIALFREAVTKGMTDSAKLLKETGMDVNMIAFSMWTEAIKDFAEKGKGNVIFLDGSPDGAQQTMKRVAALLSAQNLRSLPTPAEKPEEATV